MPPSSPARPDQEAKLLELIWSFRLDPLQFVLSVFPWGVKGTPLADLKGPRTWQRDELEAIYEHNVANRQRIAEGKNPLMYRSAHASGRGIGKSALTSWLVLHALSCYVGSTVVVAANSEPQLKSRTWAELGKWHTLSANRHWFERTALSLRPEPWYQEILTKQLQIDTGYHYAQAQLWSEECPDAFAGVHNPNGILVLFDEASGIPASIWNVTSGFFTEPTPWRYWFAFSNPRANTGEFFECFHRNRDLWRHRNIDSRTVEGVDAAYLQREYVDRYGEDNDVTRVEVKGEFPSQGQNQFISRSIVQDAQRRQVLEDNAAPLILGVDVARFGDDSSVLRWRQGRNGRVVPPVAVKGADNMALANLCAHWIEKTNPDAVCIDGGNGSGVIDRLRELGFKVHEVLFGSKPTGREYVDKRTEMWAQMREWLRGGCIDDSRDLADDLVGPGFEFRGDKLKLESKDKMKSRGLASPDHGDALACTFAVTVARKDLNASRNLYGRSNYRAKSVDYDVFA